MIMDLICDIYGDPANAPQALDLGPLQDDGTLSIGPYGTETNFTISDGTSTVTLTTGDHRLATMLSNALKAWAIIAEREDTAMKQRIAERSRK